jgi:DNA-binding response OmpR family regulator
MTIRRSEEFSCFKPGNFPNLVKLMWRHPSAPEVRKGEITTEVAAILQSPADQKTVKECAQAAGWHLTLADSVESAMSRAESASLALWILDRHLLEVDWRPYVRMIAHTRSQPCVLLASQVVDRYLFEELTRYGGFDVVPTPIGAGQLLRLGRLAITYWKSRHTAVNG